MIAGHGDQYIVALEDISPLQWVEFMNAPTNSVYSSVTIERNRPKFGSSRSQRITEHSTTSARLIA